MKMKIIAGVILALLLGIGYLSVKKDEYREDEVKDLKKSFMLIEIERCLVKQKISLKDATAKQKEKCKLAADTKWKDAKVLNSEY